MKTKLLSASLIFVLAVATSARAADEWNEFKSEAGKFSILMPKTPEFTTQKLPGGEENHVSISRIGDTAVFVMYGDFPGPSADAAIVDTVLDKARDGGIKAMMAKIRVEKKITLGGNSGRDITFDGPNNLAGREQLFLVKNRMYQVMAIGPKDKENASDVNKYFDSFKLLDK